MAVRNQTSPQSFDWISYSCWCNEPVYDTLMRYVSVMESTLKSPCLAALVKAVWAKCRQRGLGEDLCLLSCVHCAASYCSERVKSSIYAIFRCGCIFFKTCSHIWDWHFGQELPAWWAASCLVLQSQQAARNHSYGVGARKKLSAHSWFLVCLQSALPPVQGLLWLLCLICTWSFIAL